MSTTERATRVAKRNPPSPFILVDKIPDIAAETSIPPSENMPTLSVGSSRDPTIAAEISERRIISETDIAKHMRKSFAVPAPPIDLFEPNIRKPPNKSI
jgi:hypothetical protein